MRKLIAIAFVALAIPASAFAATLHSAHQNVFSCPYGGTWHFVNNQTGTTTPGSFSATFSSGTVTGTATKVTPGGTQHWTISATGLLITASSNLNGNLVLSDYTCRTKKS